MSNPKYKILFDYGSEGNSIDDDEFDSVEEAVMAAVGKNYCTQFRIITIAWDPTLRKSNPQGV